jgi:hypothetical protein
VSARPPLDGLPTLTEVIGHSPIGEPGAERVPDAIVPRDGVAVERTPGAVASGPAAVSDVPVDQTPADRRQRLLESVASHPPPPAVADDLDDWASLAWRAQAEAELVQGVLTDVQRQVDHLFEYRVREALGPLMTRLTDALVRETREELALIVRDVVRRAVAQEIAKHRPR